MWSPVVLYFLIFGISAFPTQFETSGSTTYRPRPWTTQRPYFASITEECDSEGIEYCKGINAKCKREIGSNGMSCVCPNYNNYVWIDGKCIELRTTEYHMSYSRTFDTTRQRDEWTETRIPFRPTSTPVITDGCKYRGNEICRKQNANCEPTGGSSFRCFCDGYINDLVIGKCRDVSERPTYSTMRTTWFPWRTVWTTRDQWTTRTGITTPQPTAKTENPNKSKLAVFYKASKEGLIILSEGNRLSSETDFLKNNNTLLNLLNAFKAI